MNGSNQSPNITANYTDDNEDFSFCTYRDRYRSIYILSCLSSSSLIANITFNFVPIILCLYASYIVCNQVELNHPVYAVIIQQTILTAIIRVINSVISVILLFIKYYIVLDILQLVLNLFQIQFTCVTWLMVTVLRTYFLVLKAKIDNISLSYSRSISLAIPWCIGIIFTTVRCLLGIVFDLTGAPFIVLSAVLFTLPILISLLIVMFLHGCPNLISPEFKDNNQVIKVSIISNEVRVVNEHDITNANDISSLVKPNANTDLTGSCLCSTIKMKSENKLKRIKKNINYIGSETSKCIKYKPTSRTHDYGLESEVGERIDDGSKTVEHSKNTKTCL